MSGKYQGVCVNCGKKEVLKPAGVSKKTGKPYDAFYACGTPDCWKTKKTAPVQEKPVETLNNANTEVLETVKRIEIIAQDIYSKVDDIYQALKN